MLSSSYATLGLSVRIALSTGLASVLTFTPLITIAQPPDSLSGSRNQSQAMQRLQSRLRPMTSEERQRLGVLNSIEAVDRSNASANPLRQVAYMQSPGTGFEMPLSGALSGVPSPGTGASTPIANSPSASAPGGNIVNDPSGGLGNAGAAAGSTKSSTPAAMARGVLAVPGNESIGGSAVAGQPLRQENLSGSVLPSTSAQPGIGSQPNDLSAVQQPVLPGFASLGDCACVSAPPTYTGYAAYPCGESVLVAPAGYATPSVVAPNQPAAAGVVAPVGQPAVVPAFAGGSNERLAPRPLITLGQENYPVVVGQGFYGQPTAYVPGQNVRNFIRYITP